MVQYDIHRIVNDERRRLLWPDLWRRSSSAVTGPEFQTNACKIDAVVSSNLMNWQTLFVTNPAAMPVTLADPNRNAAARFYRLQLGP